MSMLVGEGVRGGSDRQEREKMMAEEIVFIKIRGQPIATHDA